MRAQKWLTLDEVITDEGPMRLKRRDNEYIIEMESFILMNSKLNRTEIALGESACERIAANNANVLIGGLGMACTLRAALDQLSAKASVLVAELNPTVVKWCRGELAELTNSAASDPRVNIVIEDVANLITRAAEAGGKFDAIILDLYQGTHDANTDRNHPFYSRQALDRTRRALNPGGILGVWTETSDTQFEQRLKRIGFSVERTRPGKGGPRHTVYLATKIVTAPRKRKPKRR